MSSGAAIAAAERVADVVAAHREEAERDARMAEPVRRALGEAGLFAMIAPTDCGGLDATLPELWRAIELLAEADPSVAWHAANSSITGLASLRLGLEERREIYAHRSYPFGNGGVPAGRAELVEGGFCLRGDWPFITGVEHSRWNVLAGLVVADRKAAGAGPANGAGGYGRAPGCSSSRPRR